MEEELKQRLSLYLVRCKFAEKINFTSLSKPPNAVAAGTEIVPLTISKLSLEVLQIRIVGVTPTLLYCCDPVPLTPGIPCPTQCMRQRQRCPSAPSPSHPALLQR